ncbi:MAG: hypothetical protein ACK5LX_04695 [Oscillospiraceae bacterium]
MLTEEAFRNPGNQTRPLQLVHGFGYEPDATVPEALAFIKRELEHLREIGYGGVVVNAYQKQDYLVGEKYWEIFRGTIALCDKLDLRVWIYDEDGYPSGGAGTLTLEGHPEYEAKGIVCLTQAVKAGQEVRFALPHGHRKAIAVYAYDGIDLESLNPDSPRDLGGSLETDGSFRWTVDRDCLVCYIVEKPLFEGTHAANNYCALRRYINLLDKDAVERFMEVTHLQYKREVGEYFGGRIEAFFTDEPSLIAMYCPLLKVRSMPVVSEPDSAVPLYPSAVWDDQLLPRFRERYGYDLEPLLPLLFGGRSDRACQVRLDYYNLLSQLYDEAFFLPIRQFCAENGLASSGHLLHEENIYWHPENEGSFFHHMRNMDFPGIDILTSSANEIVEGMFCPKVVGSAARQYGKHHVMSESSDFSQRQEGGQAGLTEMKSAIATQYAFGVDTITSYYRGDALPVKEYREFTDFVGRMGALLEGGKAAVPIAAYYPIETASMFAFPSDRDFARRDYDPEQLRCNTSLTEGMKSLLRAQIDVDLVDDDWVASAEITPRSSCKMGDGSEFSALYIPYAVTLPAAVMMRLLVLLDKGFPVVLHAADRFVPAKEGDGGEALYQKLLAHPGVTVIQSHEALTPLAKEKGWRDITLNPSNRQVIALRCRKKGEDILLFVNTAEKGDAVDCLAAVSNTRLQQPLWSAVERWDPNTGEVFSIEARRDGESLQFPLKLGPGEVQMFRLA